MEYRFLDTDPAEVMAQERRVLAQRAVSRAILADTEVQRVERILHGPGRTEAERKAAKDAQPFAHGQASRARKAAKAVVKKARLTPEEVHGIEKQELAMALERNELQHAYRTVELEMLEAEEAELDADERDPAAVAELKRQLGLIELAHEVLLERLEGDASNGG